MAIVWRLRSCAPNPKWRGSTASVPLSSADHTNRTNLRSLALVLPLRISLVLPRCSFRQLAVLDQSIRAQLKTCLQRRLRLEASIPWFLYGLVTALADSYLSDPKEASPIGRITLTT